MSDHERYKLRKQRQRDLQRRLFVYGEIDRLELKHCDNCRGNLTADASVKQFNCGCPAAVEIKKLTRLLSSARKKPSVEFSEDGMTIEIYRKFKEQGMSDSKIAKQVPWSLTKFNKWKREAGLSDKRTEPVVSKGVMQR